MHDPAAQENWDRYIYGVNRGHNRYMDQARLCEGFYLGGGRQWSNADRESLIEQGRPALEFNQIKNKINAAVGYQIGNRMDIGFRPRAGAADQETATTLSKLAMQIADNNHLHWKETQVFSDGLIQQRGFYDVRISYEDTILGEIRIDTLDPLDVIPDPDAKSYDPDGWADVIVTRWLTAIEIEDLYGTAAAQKTQEDFDYEQLYAADGTDDDRNSFGDDSIYAEPLGDGDAERGRRYRVIDRQFWRMDRADCVVTSTGDIRVAEGMSASSLQAMVDAGGFLQKRRVRRVRWVVSTRDRVLHDDWSPFGHFTVVPFFPTFRRGVTSGLVDDAIGPQQLLNKSMSQFLHIINTTANSGWVTVAGTLANMRDDELADRGSETGLHLVVKKDTAENDKPRKITPNQVPAGFDRLIDRAGQLLDASTGVNEAMMGAQGNETSGIAIQTRQFAAQQQLAVPLDNLARTRAMLAGRMLEMIQAFYDQPRIIRITETDLAGRESVVEVPLNYPDQDRILNDLTIGEYDVIVTEAPAQITFENSQFLQALELNQHGANIPWTFILRHSNLANKQEIIDAIEQRPAPEPNPADVAKAQLTAAQTRKVEVETVSKAVEAQYSAIQTAGVIALQPATSSLADALLLSAGYEDQNAAPIVPEYDGTVMAVADLPSSTNPLTPANPGVGLNAGIQTPEIEGTPV